MAEIPDIEVGVTLKGPTQEELQSLSARLNERLRLIHLHREIQKAEGDIISKEVERQTASREQYWHKRFWELHERAIDQGRRVYRLHLTVERDRWKRKAQRRSFLEWLLGMERR